MQLILNKAITMSSREIANLTNKQHQHVKRDIEKMFTDLKEPLEGYVQKWTHPQNGQEYEEYLLDRDHVDCLLTGYSSELRMRVIKRWKELESKPLPNFNNPSEAARAWADQYDANIKLIAANQEQTTKIESLESLFVQGETIFEFCKKLNGVNANAVNRTFELKNWLYNESKSSTRWRVKSYARDRYMTEETGSIVINGIDCITHKPVLLKKGAVKIYEMYLKNELPMKKDWNGNYTQDKHLGVA